MKAVGQCPHTSLPSSTPFLRIYMRVAIRSRGPDGASDGNIQLAGAKLNHTDATVVAH